MKQKHLIVPLGLVLLLTGWAVLPDLCSAASQSKIKRTPSIKDEMLAWQVSQTTVVSKGNTVTTKQGKLKTGYTIQGKANATTADTSIKKGTFQMTLSAFSPAKDMPGQAAGHWYVQGDWNIIDDKAAAKERKARRAPVRFGGKLSATLDFDPTTTQGALDAALILPTSLTGGRWCTGKGAFSGNEKFEGVYQLKAEIWPDVAKAKGVQP